MSVHRALTVLILAASHATHALAGVGTEEVSGSFAVNGAEYDQHYSGLLSIPQFDPQGGTRELVGVEYLLDFNHEYIWNYNENPNDFNIYSFTTLSYSFQITLDSMQFFPTPNHPGHPDIPIDVETTWFSQVGANASGFGFPFGGVSGTFEEVTDPAYLATMTGTGSLDFLSEMWTIAPLIRDYDTYVATDPSWTDPEPEATFDPNTTTWDLTLVKTNLRVFYHYETVPAPGTLALLSVGALGAARRRRAG